MNRSCNTCNGYTKMENPAIETACNNIINDNYNNDNNNCNCGFDEEENVFPTNPMLGQSYVPMQYMGNTFTPCCGLKNGTIFPELVSPYYPCQSIEDIEYLRSRNTIGEGCNA